MKICDLHTHSTFSDGTYTPEQIICAAVEIGLSAVALCDHNTVDGLPRFLKAAKGKDIEAVTGAEFSVDYNGKELHLLALFIPESRFSEISDMMYDINMRKEESNRSLIRSLNRAGYDIDFDTIRNSTPNGKFNRANIGAVLTEKGYTKSIDEAFKTLLSPEAGHYKEPGRPSVWEMLSFVRSVGAIPVLAHPFLNLDEGELFEFLPVAKEKGLVGMECLYSQYDEETTLKALAMVDKFNLNYSGGSDFHGNNKPGIKLGSGKGNLKIPYDWAEQLSKKATE